MAETFVARVSLIINAPRAKVWDALVDPEKFDYAHEQELAHSQGGWQLALGNMKALLEGTSVVPMR